MNTQLSTLSWGDRFAVMDHFSPSDELIRTNFNVTQAELDTARNLRAMGTFTATKHLAVAMYADAFVSSIVQQSITNQPTKDVSTMITTAAAASAASAASASSDTKTPTATTHVMPPESASKPVKQPQKRGRKGNKITTALQSVTEVQVPVEAFMLTHGISLAVLRQAKRFQDPNTGKINVKQDKTTKKLMIWRDAV